MTAYRIFEYEIAASADYFITGDPDFTEVLTVGNTQIVSVS